jgi:hypothetical protein
MEFLRELAPAGLDVELVRPAAGQLPRALESEVSRGRVRSAASIGVVPGRPSAAAPEWCADVVAALRGDATTPVLPSISACLRTRERDGDGVLLADDEGRPLLAVRRAGAGVTATWATLPTENWAVLWRSEAGRLAALFRALGRQRASVVRPRASCEAQRLRIDDAPADWPPEIQVQIRAHDSVLAHTLLTQPVIAPGLDPRTVRSGALPPSVGGALELAVSDASGTLLEVLGLDLPLAEEFRWPARAVVAVEGISESRENAPGGAAQARSGRVGAVLLLVGVLACAVGTTLGAARRG